MHVPSGGDEEERERLCNVWFGDRVRKDINSVFGFPGEKDMEEAW